MRKPVFIYSFLFVLALAASAQDTSSTRTTPQTRADQQPTGHEMPGMPGMQMNMPPSPVPSPHSGSGTAWEPVSTPEHMWMTRAGQWDIMAHGVAFVSYNQQGGPRGTGKAESMNWLMFMEQHKLWNGTLLFRQMFSAEAITAPPP